MHQFILKIFSKSKNFIYFLKILAIFFLMLHLILWVQNLTSAHYGWLQIFVPILNVFIGIGESISRGSIDAFGALFEFKYMIAVCIYIGFYYLWNYTIILIEKLEDKYDDVHRHFKKTEENAYNVTLHTEQKIQEWKINRYKVFVTTSIKKKFSHKELGYDLNEQNDIMNDFLMKKTGVQMIMHNGGFLYEFDNFFRIDDTLEIFFKLIKSSAPLDYVICVETVEETDKLCLEKIDELAGLGHVNKISTFADCVYRYKFNRGHRYGTSQLGLFQKDNDTVEVHEFIEIL